MTSKIRKTRESDRTPNTDESFFTTTCNNFQSWLVNKGVDSFLMQIESLSFFISQVIQIVEMDATIKRTTHYTLHIQVIFDFGYPASVTLLRSNLNKSLVFLIFFSRNGFGLSNKIKLG